MIPGERLPLGTEEIEAGLGTGQVVKMVESNRVKVPMPLNAIVVPGLRLDRTGLRLAHLTQPDKLAMIVIRTRVLCNYHPISPDEHCAGE